MHILKKYCVFILLGTRRGGGFLCEWKSVGIAIMEKIFGACHQNEECNIRRPAQTVKKQILLDLFN